MTVNNPWSTELGGFDDYVGTVTEAWFAVDPTYNAEALLLHMSIKSDDLEQERVEKFSVGKGWVTEDQGKTAVHETGNPTKKFHQKSAYGMIIDRVVKDDAFKGLLAVLQERGSPTEAAVWNGITLHFRKESIDYGSDIGTKSKLLPIEWVQDAPPPRLTVAGKPDFNDGEF